MLDKNHPYNKAYPAGFPYAADMGLTEDVASVEKTDGHTVKIALKNVNAPFLQNPAMPFAYILSAEYAAWLEKQTKPPTSTPNPSAPARLC